MNLDFVKNLVKRNPEQEDVYIQPLQMDINGQYDPEASAQLGLQIQQNTTPLTIQDRLLGREMTQDYQSIDPSTNQAVMSTVTNYKPGALNDLASGFRENYTQGFAPENLAGGKKGLATRIGEGLGTVARFYDKPIGRFATAVALSNLTGETNPWQQGVEAYIGRQGNIARNKVYGDSLKQMGYTDEDLAGINLTDDIYKNAANTAYRTNMMNYRNLKLDKDTFLKEQKQIGDLLNNGLINAQTAMQYMQALNDEYERQNPIEMQEGNKTIQGNRRLDILERQGNRRLDIQQVQGDRRLNIAQQNADTAAKNATIRELNAQNKGSGRPTRNIQSVDTGFVKMKAPNGKIYNVPSSRVQEMVENGGQIVG